MFHWKRPLYFLYCNTKLGFWLTVKEINRAKLKFGDGAHSVVQRFASGNIRIFPVPYSSDNYAYVVQNCTTNDVVVVDVGDSEAVEKILKKNNLTPHAVLTTHRDHCCGNRDIKLAYPDIEILGSEADSAFQVTRYVEHEEIVTIGSLIFRVFLTPGHTIGHCVFVLQGKELESPDCVFSGDLLFVGGSGKVFEGTGEMMIRSLDLISKLPEDSLIWPGHEYAKDNLSFAVRIEPVNKTVNETLDAVLRKRSDSLCTSPTCLGEEKKYNPFLRTDSEEIRRNLGWINCNNDVSKAQVFEKLRFEKDNWSRSAKI